MSTAKNIQRNIAYLTGEKTRPGGNDVNFPKITQTEYDTLRPLSYVDHVDPKSLSVNKLNSVFDEISKKDFETLKADIQERGVLVPLILKVDRTTLLAGHNRLKVAIELNLLTVPVQYLETELDKESEKEFVIKDNLLRRQLTASQKLALIETLYGREISEAKHGGKRGNRHTKQENESTKIQLNLAKRIEQETGIKSGTAQRFISDIRKRNAPEMASRAHQKPTGTFETDKSHQTTSESDKAIQGYFMRFTKDKEQRFKRSLLFAFRGAKRQERIKFRKLLNGILGDFDRIENEKD